MTIYRDASPTAPSLAQNLGQATGSFLGEGLQALAEQKVRNLTSGLKRQQEIQKYKDEAKSRLASTAKNTGRSSYIDRSDIMDDINSLYISNLEKGYPRATAEEMAFRQYESLGEGTTPARVWDLFKEKETPESKKLTKRSSEKSKTATSLDEFSLEEILTLDPDDIENLPNELQSQLREILPGLVKQHEARTKVAAVPFIGKALEERFREKATPNLAPPPGIAGFSRFASELPFIPAALGKGSLVAKAVKGAAFFGGDAMVAEAVRTLGTDKPVDLPLIGVQSLVGGLIPLGEAAIKPVAKLFRNALAKEMKFTGKAAAEASEAVLKRAEKSGLSTEVLQKGEKEDVRQFSKFLREDAHQTAKKTQQKVSPDVKGKGETIKGRSEAPKEAEKRFKKESKALSETPIEEYMKPPKIKKTGLIERRERLTPLIEKNRTQIQQVEKNLFKETGVALRNSQQKLEKLHAQNYEFGHEIKYGKLPPSPQQIGSQVEKSLETLVKDVMEGGPEVKKKFATNDKLMNTFLEKSKKDLIRGTLPESVAKDTFLNINREYLNAYKDLRKHVRQEMALPMSRMNASQAGPEILHQLEKRIKGLEAAVTVQDQKRKVLASLKGPKGTYYRKWVDDIKKENNLFSKDLIRIGDKISHGERNISKTAIKKIEEAGSKATKEGPAAVETLLVTKGAKPSSAKEAAQALEKIKNPPDISSPKEMRTFFNKYLEKVLRNWKTETIAGLVLGALDQGLQEGFGIKLPTAVKAPLVSVAGLSSISGRAHPVGALSSTITSAVIKKIRKSRASASLKSKKGGELLKEYEKIKTKKGFTAKEFKQIRSA